MVLTMDDAKLYTGTKTLKALAMSRATYVAYRGWELPADENGADEGYLVEYTDGGKPNVAGHAGYVSWSPKDVFERTYKEGDGVAGLPVAGYKPTQPPEAIAAVNYFKELEERTLRHIDELETNVYTVSADRRWLAIGRTQLQQAFMALNRAIFQPGRVELPGDKDDMQHAGEDDVG